MKRRDFNLLLPAALLAGCRDYTTPVPAASSPLTTTGTSTMSSLVISLPGTIPSNTFIPDAGFTQSGGVGFDVSGFTIAQASGFGASGPALILFDDFRNATGDGNAIPNGASPVLGTATWDDVGRNGVLWKAGNRTGGGFCYRWLNNTDSSNYTQKKIQLSAGATTTALYFFYAENAHGWNYQAAGSYYKHNWFLLDQHTVNAFEQCLPTFVNTTNGYFTGNDSDLGGAGTGPLPQWNIGDLPHAFDANNWNSVECGYVGDPSNPTSNNGIQYFSVYNPANGRFAGTNNSRILFNSGSGSAGTYAAGDQLNFPGFCQSLGTQTIDRADVYVATGANAYKRFFITDKSTLAASTTMMPCTIDSWSDTSVAMTPRRGGFAATLNGSGNHLWWADASNNITHVGRFA